jgi:hypothetical protein
MGDRLGNTYPEHKAKGAVKADFGPLPDDIGILKLRMKQAFLV